jgi:phospholipid/cholesterol/gamma-HCH transport system substrate-binding protein
MDPKVLQFRVGVMVLATIVLATVLALMFGDFGAFWRPSYEIHVRLADATGVQPGTPVRKSGVLIGRVSNVSLSDDGALVTLLIDQHVTLRHNETCQLRTSLFGDAELIFVLRE